MLYTSDHLNAVVADRDAASYTNDGNFRRGSGLNVFESVTIQAAMAATTTRPEIGCIVMSNAYRNPNMTAFIASTIDHDSGGRFVLGIGTGFFKLDFDEFGYDFGTQRSRSEELARSIPLFLQRFDQLTPPPAHRIPLMIASMGDKIGLPLVARYADVWHAYGPFEKLQEKWGTLGRICAEQGRDVAEIEFATNFMPTLLTGPDDTLENYVALGCRQIVVVAQGPEWDLGELREVLQWRDGLASAGQ